MAADNRIRIKLLSIVNGTYTNSEGESLFKELDKYLSGGQSVTIDFTDCHAVSSSFLNSSIGEIFMKYGYDSLKGRIGIVNSTKSQKKQISDYITYLKEETVGS
ncbi:MAG: STAS-like domain-containing protein [Bacteroidia bacterium]|nr:STAS-like domain-containing protein [Bacteroidia bacterium]